MPSAHISLAALSHNVAVIRSHVQANTRMLAAVKANAYGHGAVATARYLETCGVTWFGVATAEEALELRAGGISAEILIFMPVYNRIAELVEQAITLTVADRYSLDIVKAAGVKAQVHLKVDTGMGRLGLGWQQAVPLAQQLEDEATLEFGGVWTHFAASDDEDRTATEAQLEAFHAFLAELVRQGINPPLVHSANSAAIFAHPDSHFDMVRPGIALYGYHSSPFIAGLESRLKPALTLTAPITYVKQVKKGTPISYSQLWRAPRDTTIATVRIGYADGYPRSLTGKADVLVQGQPCQIAGRICMDQLMVDVGDLAVAVGDRVTLLTAGHLNAELLAERVGTISYELLVRLGARVQRDYS